MARKRNPNFVAAPVQGTGTIGALAQNAAVLGALWTPTHDVKVITLEAIWSYFSKTAGEGPVEFGVADGDLSLAEIEEYLELTYTEPFDRIARERAGRHVRRIGAFTDTEQADGVANDGQPIRTKLNWKIGAGNGLIPWWYNRGSGVMAAGMLTRIEGTCFAVWLGL